MMSGIGNKTITGGDCRVRLLNDCNKRSADNYDLLLKQSLVNNDLIMENIFKWLEPTQLTKCSTVCTKWRFYVQLLRRKRKFFSNESLYLIVYLRERHIQFKGHNICNSLEEVIDSYNRFITRNKLNEFQTIIIFSNLEFNQMPILLGNQWIPNDCKVIHINCRNEIIGLQFEVKSKKTVHYLEAVNDFHHLSGISALFMSREMPGIEVNSYNDSKIFDIKSESNLKCVLVFHIWRSFYGHFSRLKTDSEYFDHLERFVNICDNIAFGGVTVDRIIDSEAICDESKVFNNFLDNICCITFSGPNVRAFSLVIDFNDSESETHLNNLNNEMKLWPKSNTETIGFVFSDHFKDSIIKLKDLFENITIIGCSGITHGFSNISSTQNKTLFFNKEKCVFVIIQLFKE